jgi:hypothetical protein
MTEKQKISRALALAFARGILDGEQLLLILELYRK